MELQLEVPKFDGSPDVKKFSMSDDFNIKYREKWESRSSIRTRPRKCIDFNQDGYFFPEDKQPLLLNQEVINLGEKAKEEILLQSFFKYLSDIINLEVKLISSVCGKILYSSLGKIGDKN